MKQLINPSTDPYFNLALEEYVLSYMDDEYFFLWQNRPAIIVGRNQNTIAEINREYVEEHNISVVRRLTGGGAVYHDLGNLNFTFIVNDREGYGFDFARYTRPIINALAQIGIKAAHSGRNDITIDGKKFSGNSQYRYKNRLLHHGTLLFASDLTVLGQALQVRPQKIESKGVKSVQSRVTNISEYLTQPLTMEEFKRIIAESLAEEYNVNSAPLPLTEEMRKAVEDLVAQKYGTWEWNYGSSPDYDISNSQRFDWGEVEVFTKVKKGLIEQIRIFGDFFSNREIAELENSLLGTPFRKEEVMKRVKEIGIKDYLPFIEEKEFCDLITG